VLAWRARRMQAEGELAAARRAADAAEGRVSNPRRGDYRADLLAEARACADRVVSLTRNAAALLQREEAARRDYDALTSVANVKTNVKRNITPAQPANQGT
jgi:hypothetical protein